MSPAKKGSDLPSMMPPPDRVGTLLHHASITRQSCAGRQNECTPVDDEVNPGPAVLRLRCGDNEPRPLSSCATRKKDLRAQQRRALTGAECSTSRRHTSHGGASCTPTTLLCVAHGAAPPLCDVSSVLCGRSDPVRRNEVVSVSRGSLWIQPRLQEVHCHGKHRELHCGSLCLVLGLAQIFLGEEHTAILNLEA